MYKFIVLPVYPRHVAFSKQDEDGVPVSGILVLKVMSNKTEHQEALTASLVELLNSQPGGPEATFLRLHNADEALAFSLSDWIK